MEEDTGFACIVSEKDMISDFNSQWDADTEW